MTETGRTETPVELSVIIAARNAADVLPALLTSLAAQTWTGAWEVIVVDNGSVDGTGALAETFTSLLPHLRVIDASRQPGQAYARNAGVAVASGTSVAFVDADDEVEPTYIAAMGQALRRNRFVAARLDCVTLNAGWVRHSRPPPGPVDGLGAALGWLPLSAGCSLGIRRDLFLNEGGFNAELPPAEDIDLCWRLLLDGVELTLVPDAVIRYRYRTRFYDIFGQARGYGRSVPNLYRRYRDRGMPRRHGMRIVRFWLGPIRRLINVRTKADLALIVYLVGFRVGLVEGCWRARVLYV